MAGTYRLESRMPEIGPSGSEGGGAFTRSPYPYPNGASLRFARQRRQGVL